MNLNKSLPFFATVLLGFSVFGSGFALYEPSAAAHALGGATVGKAVDASANFINPATLDDLTNVTITVGFVTEHPRCKVNVNGVRDERLDAGLFWLPHFMLAVPLPYGFTLGLGGDAEYGLGTKYDHGWSMEWSTRETTVQGYVLTPNLSYAITDDWSVGAGLRWLYFDFEQYSAFPLFGGSQNRLKGNNGFEDIGWQVGTRYKILDNLSVGLVYKAEIDATIKGKCTYDPQLSPYLKNGDAHAKMKLPQSVTGGVNWDITDTVHLGAAVSWTEWSTFDTLIFNLPKCAVLPTGQKPVGLYWHDTWRFAIAPSWDFLDDWTFMLSYIYDMDSTDSHQTSAMLPPADRHILGGGFRWRATDNLELTLSYTCIFMAGGDMMTKSPYTGANYRLHSHDGFCHAGGFSVTYKF